MNLEDWDEGGREYRIVLKLNPGLLNAHAGWGYVLMKQGKLDEAIGQFRIALEIDPAYELARTNLERALRLQKK